MTKQPENRPEQILILLFIQASYKHPANMAAQGIWLNLLFREGQASGTISPQVTLDDLDRARHSEEVLERLAKAACHAHRHRSDINEVSAKKVDGILRQVVEISQTCVDFDEKMLFTLLEILEIYMQVSEFVPLDNQIAREDEGDSHAIHPELLLRKNLIKTIIDRDFPLALRPVTLRLVENTLFSMMVWGNDYVAVRLGIFMRLLSVPIRRHVANS